MNANLPKPFFVLAPMDDVTDTVFRQIIADCSPPDLYFTEFVNVDGLQSAGRSKIIHKLQFIDKEKPIIAQLWGLKPQNFYKTTLELKKMGFAGVDLNFGCPVKVVIKQGACAAFIDKPEAAGEIIKQVRRAAGDSSLDSEFPVSVKTRLGNSEVDWSWIEYLLKQKLNMLTIHGRTVKQMSKVSADWEAIGKVVALRDKLSPSTLIVGNGDVLSRQQGEALAKKYNLDGIMIARGIFNDPYVFNQHSKWSAMGKEEKVALYRKHVQLFAKTWPNADRKIRTLNKFCKVYINGFAGAKELREKLMKSNSTTELIALLDSEV